MFNNFSKRSYEPEIMDDLDMVGDELAVTLRQIANVNRWLGGTSVALSGIKKILRQNKNQNTTLKIIDIGCGGGEILRAIADWGRKNNLKMELTGLDANQFTVDFAKSESKSYPEIKFQKFNVYDVDNYTEEFDIALCSLFLHHFKEEEINKILSLLVLKANMGVVINDLHRSAIAYYLFKLVTTILGASQMVKCDGLLSIRKSFKRNELEDFAIKSGASNYKINWKWAFRFELLLLNPNKYES